MLNTEHNEQVGNVAVISDDSYPMQDLEEVNVECFDMISEISPAEFTSIKRLPPNNFGFLEYLKPKRDNENDNKRLKTDRHVSLKSGRLNELLAFPQIYQDAVNSQNIDSVRNLINEYMLEDCVLKTPALSEPVQGRHYVISLLESLLRSVTPFHLTFNEVHLSEGEDIVKASGPAEGVIVRRDTSDNLWNDVAHRNENASFRDKIKIKVRRFIIIKITL